MIELKLRKQILSQFLAIFQSIKIAFDKLCLSNAINEIYFKYVINL